MKDKMEKTVNIERMLHLKNSKKENINNKNKAGISLIILVVTIIVIIILVGTVILSLTNNNPINEANEATFKSNIETYNSEITLYLAKQYTSTMGTFKLENLNKDSGNIKTDVIKSMKDSDVSKFEIQKGVIVYIKDKCTTNEIKWLTDIGIKEKNISSIIPIPVGGSVFKDKNNKEVPVPEGFIVDNLNNIVNDGLVIKDRDGNEFVWIPSKEISGGFVRRNLRNETFNSSNFNEDYSLDSGEYKEIKDSETKYGIIFY